MELQGTFTVARPRSEVWAALNDPEVLRDSIPGCETLVANGTGYEAIVALKIGPVKARFAGRVTIEASVPEDRLVLSGEGNGGVAGFAKGSATVTLADMEMGTEVRYLSTVAVGGKFAQLGSRLIASTSRKLAEQFFDRLNQTLSQMTESAG